MAIVSVGSADTTGVTFWDLVARVAKFLGVGTSPFESTGVIGSGIVPSGQDFRDIKEIIDDGYKQFLWPPAINGRSHSWSFLAPETTIALSVAGGWEYDLPATFESLVGTFHYDTTVSALAVQMVDAALIKDARAANGGISGYPYLAAIVPAPFINVTGQRFKLQVYPTPDAAYTWHYRHKVRPIPLSVTRIGGWGEITTLTTLFDVDVATAFTTAGVAYNDKCVLWGTDDLGPRETTLIVQSVTDGTHLLLLTSASVNGPTAYDIYPGTLYALGGPEHSQTLIESCLAIAELAKDDKIGLHHQKFMVNLAGSIDRDLELGPKYLGYCGDGETEIGWNRSDGGVIYA